MLAGAIGVCSATAAPRPRAGARRRLRRAARERGLSDALPVGRSGPGGLGVPDADYGAPYPVDARRALCAAAGASARCGRSTRSPPRGPRCSRQADARRERLDRGGGASARRVGRGRGAESARERPTLDARAAPGGLPGGGRAVGMMGPRARGSRRSEDNDRRSAERATACGVWARRRPLRATREGSAPTATWGPSLRRRRAAGSGAKAPDRRRVHPARRRDERRRIRRSSRLRRERSCALCAAPAAPTRSRSKFAARGTLHHEELRVRSAHDPSRRDLSGQESVDASWRAARAAPAPPPRAARSTLAKRGTRTCAEADPRHRGGRRRSSAACGRPGARSARSVPCARSGTLGAGGEHPGPGFG